MNFMSDFWSLAWLLLLLLMQSPCQHDHLAITIGTVVWSLRTSSSLNVQGAAKNIQAILPVQRLN
jgi:hypothetical protein